MLRELIQHVRGRTLFSDPRDVSASALSPTISAPDLPSDVEQRKTIPVLPKSVGSIAILGR